MTKTWRFHPEVAAEVEATARWYEKERTGLGVEFALTVNAVIATLKEMPSLGSPIADAHRSRRIRRVFLPRFPHAIVFVERSDEYFVLAVSHLRRQPDYWRERLDDA